MTFFVFIGQFFFQNDVFKLQEDFKIHCGIFPKPINQGFFNVFGRLIEVG
jgi:hypothetical protein